MVCSEFASPWQSTADYSDHQLDTEAGEVTPDVGNQTHGIILALTTQVMEDEKRGPDLPNALSLWKLCVDGGASLKLRARTGPTTRDRTRLLTDSMFRSVGLGAMVTRHAILPIEGVGCATFPQEPVQSDSTNTACAARRGAVR